MKEIKKEQLQYYCNSIGELHECGRRMLSSVDAVSYTHLTLPTIGG